MGPWGGRLVPTAQHPPGSQEVGEHGAGTTRVPSPESYLWSPATGVLCNVPCSVWLCAVEAARGLCEQTSGQSLAAAKETTNAARERNRALSSGTAQPSWQEPGRRVGQGPSCPCPLAEWGSWTRHRGAPGTTTPEMVAMPQTVPTCCWRQGLIATATATAAATSVLALWLSWVTGTLWFHGHWLNWGDWRSQPGCGGCCSISSGIWGHVAGASSQPMSVACPAPAPALPGQSRTAAGPGGAGP